MKRLLSALVFFLIPTGLGGSSAWAQLDPTKVLVGTWEGWLAPYEFTLIIESVTPQDGGWVARGRFGRKDGNVRRRSIPVSQQRGRYYPGVPRRPRTQSVLNLWGSASSRGQ